MRIHLSLTLLRAVVAAVSLSVCMCATTATTRDDRPVLSDVPFIRCELCAHVASAVANATRRIMSLRRGASTGLSSELDLYDAVEAVCDPDAVHGRWLKQVDLVEVGRALTVDHRTDGVQRCRRECRTVALACRDVLDGIETEVAELLYSHLKKSVKDTPDSSDLAQLVQTSLCASSGSALSQACRHKVRPLPEDRPHGPPFQPDEALAADMDEEKLAMHAQMDDLAKKTGQKMKLYSKDDLPDLEDKMEHMRRRAGQTGGAQTDDDDDDDEL